MTTNITPQADRMIRHAAHNLIHLAAIHGLLPTLETQPRQPLAMGNHSLRLTLRPVRNPDPAAADNCRRPDLLEKLTYHEGARHDMSLEDCMSFLADGWKETPGRSYTQLVLQLTELLAAAPSKPYCWSDCTAYTAGIEGELQALRKKVATYEARDALRLIPQHAPAAITASLMRDDGGDAPAFCLMAAYRTEADARAAFTQLGLPISEGKPSWDSHNWPQIVQDSSGNWFGVRDGWAMSIVGRVKGDELNLLREDGEFLQRGTPSPDWRTSLERRPAASATHGYAPLTIAEARNLTCMLAGAPWPDEVLPELQELLTIYDNLRAAGNRPVDPAKTYEQLLVNPWTGEARDARDVESDPKGLLIIPPGGSVLAKEGDDR